MAGGAAAAVSSGAKAIPPHLAPDSVHAFMHASRDRRPAAVAPSRVYRTGCTPAASWQSPFPRYAKSKIFFCSAVCAPPVPVACGFGLDYLDTEDDAQLPDALQERIDTGELFFRSADEAMNFESQLRSYEAIKGKKKLPWRYRWPDDVRDDVLARLLALNAERYAEEVAQGLHSKGKKKAATDKKLGRPAKAAASEASEQMGLGL